MKNLRVALLSAVAALACAAAASAQVDLDPPPAQEDPNTIVVPLERPVPLPPGDARSTVQRMTDIRAWDRCVTRAQAVADSDPTRYQAETPEELCRRSLGMTNRTAVPISRD